MHITTAAPRSLPKRERLVLPRVEQRLDRPLSKASIKHVIFRHCIQFAISHHGWFAAQKPLTTALHVSYVHLV